MRKILISGFLMVACLAQAELISWRVDVGGGNGFYATAQLYATTANTTVIGDGTAMSSKIAKYDNSFGVLTTDTTLTVGNSYKFFVALFTGNDDASFVVSSALMSWDDLVSAGSLWNGILPAPPGTTYWNAVPEPTSIGLLAIGMSALLLRRRRRV